MGDARWGPRRGAERRGVGSEPCCDVCAVCCVLRAVYYALLIVGYCDGGSEAAMSVAAQARLLSQSARRILWAAVTAGGVRRERAVVPIAVRSDWQPR